MSGDGGCRRGGKIKIYETMKLASQPSGLNHQQALLSDVQTLLDSCFGSCG